ncbi:alpha/beta hydrolase [Legionella israelensis]|uniref:Alpha/beta hydrolase n=1 Tax=Legionella israelensis TaxID=454 RepID=A0AAX1EIC2_9GAMM|nr:alpha/beta hydrolase [Legionella israelensis]QBR84898.1 alpha/beta hydrolase [Legionella israelensis]QDP73379.1 alpha/beta hydrolase [Legionella israelensis]
MSDISRGKIAVKGFDDPEMDFQLIRQLGSSTYGGASVGECLGLANRISQGDPEDWVKEFERLAEWQKKDGMERLAKDHIVSAREQLFKACNSYRAAEYYSPCSSEHHQKLGLNSEHCFGMAITAMDIHYESHSIPYKNIHIPAYFISPANDGVKRKTIMIVSGFDGTLEEEFLMRGLAAIQRGYNVIHFAGPGQMDVFRRYSDTYFEPDFENVVKKVIDHFEFRQEVDMEHLSLLGISIGGYFVTRAASHEPRIKALIANSPILDVFSYLSSFIGYDPTQIPDEEDFTIEDLPSIPDSEFPKALKVQSEQLMIRYGRHSFKNTFVYLRQFIVGEAISNIECPCFAMIGSSEGGEPRKQFDEFCQAVGADYYEFSDFEGAGTHCQVGNVSFANAVMYDWLTGL